MTKAETCPALSMISIAAVSEFFLPGAGKLVGGRKIINRLGSSTNIVTNPPSGIIELREEPEFLGKELSAQLLTQKFRGMRTLRIVLT
jgi:hypothetical protein